MGFDVPDNDDEPLFSGSTSNPDYSGFELLDGESEGTKEKELKKEELKKELETLFKNNNFIDGLKVYLDKGKKTFDFWNNSAEEESVSETDFKEAIVSKKYEYSRLLTEFCIAFISKLNKEKDKLKDTEKIKISDELLFAKIILDKLGKGETAIGAPEIESLIAELLEGIDFEKTKELIESIKIFDSKLDIQENLKNM